MRSVGMGRRWRLGGDDGMECSHGMIWFLLIPCCLDYAQCSLRCLIDSMQLHVLM